MTLRRQFDYTAFVEGYREACKPWGIDPEQGATGYQVVRVLAERERRRWLAIPREERLWWRQRHEAWLMAHPYRSDTEHEAFWRLFVQAYALTMLQLERFFRRREREREREQV